MKPEDFQCQRCRSRFDPRPRHLRRGGEIIGEGAEEVLSKEPSELTLELHIPDERMNRVGKSVAAASLPQIKDLQ